MKLKIGLFDGTITAWQQAILVAWSLALVGVIALWAPRGVELLTGGGASAMLSIGQLLGLLATFFALTQFLLMGRIAWIERAFGLDRLAAYHRFNGYAAIILILLHPIFIVTNHALLSGRNYFAEYLTTLNTQPYAWGAFIAEILFVTVVVSSIYIARKHLKFETWYFVHLMVYAAIVLVPFHQFVNGGTLAGSAFATACWLSLYGFVALNLLIWRFGLPVYNFFTFDFRISRVVAETPTTTSVYIKARQLHRLRLKPGQFIMVRIFARKLWWQEHPFSVSWIPHDNELRMTIRKVGDYTTDIAELKPGARVTISGPFGRFTSQVAITSKRLFIAGGVGITPIRCLAEESAAKNEDTVLLYANRDASDVVLKDEIDKLASNNRKFEVKHVYSDAKKGTKGFSGRIDGALIKKLVPDFSHRDIYICGPPPMMAAIVADLKVLGVKPEQIHYERFALHSS